MKFRKVRGHKRRWKSIERWIENDKHLDLEYLKENECDYSKIAVNPWNCISFSDCMIPEPKRDSKQRIISGLIEIYNSWKISLDNLQEPYYLKIWLFNQRFSNSQVVCAIGNRQNYYENLFYKPECVKELNSDSFGIIKDKIIQFDWDYRLDEEHLDFCDLKLPFIANNEELIEIEKNRIEKLLKKSHRVSQYDEPIEDIKEYYSFKIGDIWIGSKK